ncbi:MAG: cytidylate kinase family protein [Patescibacteria group bacterium]|nr:cytidylate kinase family protein [Patescibacteria group bacterium]
MIISISGFHGSGKSTIAEMLAKKLNWPRYYMGGLRREAALKRGMTLAEYNKLGETDPSTDLEVDNYQKELGQIKDNFIIEGRTSWHFIPHSLKIYINVDHKIGAERIFKSLQKKNNRNEDNNLNTLEDVIKSVEERYKSDKLRYKKYFNIDVYDLKNYDFVINTDKISIDQVFENVYSFIKKELEKEALTKNK